MESIVTSINIYNFHLFVAYLDEGIKIIKFEDFRGKFKQLKTPYFESVSLKNTLSEIVFYGNQLLGIEEYKIKVFPLNQYSRAISNDLFLEKDEIMQLSFNFIRSSLYTYSNDNIVDRFILKNNNVVGEKKFEIKSLENYYDTTVSNMISSNDEVFLSIRGFGVSEITEDSTEKIYRTQDAQDVCFLEKNKIIIVADAFDGLVFFEKNNSKPIKKVKLEDNDFAQEIKIFNNNILIKGKYGLYIYDINDSALYKIWNGSIGAFATYYNMIFFSSKGKIYMISRNENTISEFKHYNADKTDININKFSF